MSLNSADAAAAFARNFFDLNYFKRNEKNRQLSSKEEKWS